jgi:hypothetical protein
MREVADDLRREIAATAPRLRAFSEEQTTRDRGRDKWVPKEILGHLIDSAANNHQRFVRARFTNPFTTPGYDQRAWVAAHGYRERPWGELVDLWASLNTHVAAAMDSVPPESLATTCIIGDNPPATLDWVMRDYMRHLRHHLAQIFEGSAPL